MKNLLFGFILFLVTALYSCETSRGVVEYNNPVSPVASVSYQSFYDGLSPYGHWVDYPGQGYVWVPNEMGFRPYYSNGHWAYTNFGWTWVSSYNWGWAPFHYGRWMNDAAYGWMWVPGYEWAPAWVSWRRNEECYGWAPLGPHLGIGISIGMEIPFEHWAFVPREHIYATNVNNYYINQSRNVTIINNTTVINNNYYNNNKVVYAKGPDAAEVEKVTHNKIIPIAIKETDRPGNTELKDGALHIYKPVVKSENGNSKGKPANLVALKDLQNERNRENPGQVDNMNKEKVNNNPALPDNNLSKPKVNDTRSTEVNNKKIDQPAKVDYIKPNKDPENNKNGNRQNNNDRPRNNKDRPNRKNSNPQNQKNNNPRPLPKVTPGDKQPNKKIPEGGKENKDG